MTTQRIVLLVLFVMCMFLWLLANLGAVPIAAMWVAFFAVLIVGIAEFIK